MIVKQTVTLEPGESKTVSFVITPTEARGYSVNVDGLSGMFVANPAPVADIQLENLVVTPPEVFVGEEVSISITATNYGLAAGSKEITCEVL